MEVGEQEGCFNGGRDDDNCASVSDSYISLNDTQCDERIEDNQSEKAIDKVCDNDKIYGGIDDRYDRDKETRINDDRDKDATCECGMELDGSESIDEIISSDNVNDETEVLIKLEKRIEIDVDVKDETKFTLSVMRKLANI